jgi:hypothetical protein
MKTLATPAWVALVVVGWAAWSAPPGRLRAEEPPEANQLVIQLGSDEFGQREAATKALAALGDAAAPALRKGIRSPDIEVSHRAGLLLRKILQRHESAALTVLSKFDAQVERSGKSPDSPVLRIVLKNAPAKDANLAALEPFDQLQSLYIQNTEITGAGLTHLENLPALQELYLPHVPVADADLAPVGKLSRLRVLYLVGAKTTDAGLEHLRDLAKLERLELDDTAITDEGLEELRKLKGLKFLSIGGTNVTEAGVAALRKARPDLEVHP